MLVPKLTIPLVKDKILQNAVSCSMATATISDKGFSFIVSRLSKECLCKIVTGLDLPTSPKVLRKIFQEFSGKVTFKIFTGGFFHPKVYIFVLTDKSKVAFIGSGNFTMGGFQRNEELFYKLSSPKEIQDLIDWFDDYFRRSVLLTEEIIKEYEKVYPVIKDREERNKREKQQFKDFISGKFNWDNIDFSNQYFKLEDFLTFEESKSHLNTLEIRSERIKVQNKLLDLHDSVKEDFCHPNRLFEHYDSNHIISSLDPIYHHEHRLRSMWLAYGRSKAELEEYHENARHMEFIRLQVIIEQRSFGIWLMPGKEAGGTEDREYFRTQMGNLNYRTSFYKLLFSLRKPYWIEVAGEAREVDSFESPEALWEFTNNDDLAYYFIIGRNYEPGDKAISEDNILGTIKNEFTILLPLYQFMKDKSFD